MKQTFHIFVKVRTTQQRIVRMANDKEAARAEAEADGFEVIKVRHAPAPAGMGAPVRRR